MDFATLLPGLKGIMARAADEAISSRRSPSRAFKPDGSIVTNSDEAVEAMLRTALTDLLPNTGFWGEESGHDVEGENGLWAVDPIDGTSNFSFGSPLWGISVALISKGRIELGAVALPDLGETYLCANRNGVTCNGEPMMPIPPGQIERHDLVSYNDNVIRAAAGSALPGKMRCSGAFVIDGCFTLQQRYRGMIGVREKLYDVAACALMGEELGCEVRYADGSPFVVEELLKDKKVAKPWLIFPRDSGFGI